MNPNPCRSGECGDIDAFVGFTTNSARTFAYRAIGLAVNVIPLLDTVRSGLSVATMYAGEAGTADVLNAASNRTNGFSGPVMVKHKSSPDTVHAGDVVIVASVPTHDRPCPYPGVPSAATSTVCVAESDHVPVIAMKYVVLGLRVVTVWN